MKKIKNLFNKKNIIYLSFFIIFSFLPLLKVHAVDLLTLTKFTAPANNTLTTNQDLNFSATFLFPNLTASVPATDIYKVYFQPYCVDNTGNSTPKQGIWITNPSPKKISSQGKSLTYSWKLPNGGGCPQIATSIRWELNEQNMSGEIINSFTAIQQNTTFATGANAGYYYIYKYYVTGDAYYSYGVSSKFVDTTSCTTSSANFIAQKADPNYTTWINCGYYYAQPDITTANYKNNPVPTPVTGQKTSAPTDVYTLLAPIGEFKVAPKNIGDYFNTIFLIAIGLCGALAVIMIVIGGIQYMGDESIFGKTEAKGKITSAILGLLIALGAYALLNTINPDLLGGNINIKQVSAEIGGDTDTPIIFNKNTLPTGIICSGDKTNIPNIVNSFKEKMTYEMGAKGVAGPNNTIKLDCSGFVNYVLKCANVSFVNGGTASIFNGAEKVTSISGTKVNNIELKIGDLVGWRAGENSEKYGHVMIYVGNGQVQVADSHGGSTIGNALGVFSITKYQNRIKYIRRAP